jgi:hypothetical protein
MMTMVSYHQVLALRYGWAQHPSLSCDTSLKRTYVAVASGVGQLAKVPSSRLSSSMQQSTASFSLDMLYGTNLQLPTPGIELLLGNTVSYWARCLNDSECGKNWFPCTR